MGVNRTRTMSVKIVASVALLAAIAYGKAADAAAIAVKQDLCPHTAPFFGFAGAAAALVFACLGAAYGTAKSGVGVTNMGVLHHDLVMKSIIPVVMAGVIGIYGLIVAVLLCTQIDKKPHSYSSIQGYGALGSGLSCGFAGLAAGLAIGLVGDAGVRCTARQPKLFVGVILVLIFAEALGLYGLIVALIMSGKKLDCTDV